MNNHPLNHRQSTTAHSIWKSGWLTLILVLADTLGFSFCWKGAYYLRLSLNEMMGPINAMAPYLRVHGLIVLVGLLNCAFFGLYMHRRRLSSLNRPSTLLRAGYHWLLYIVVISFFFKELDLGRSVIIFAAAGGLFYLFLSRGLLRALKARAIQKGLGTVRCVIIGTGNLAIEVREFLKTHPEIGYTLAGMIKHGQEKDSERLEELGVRLIGTTENLSEVLSSEGIEEVFVAVAHLESSKQMQIVDTAQQRGVHVHVVSNVFDVITEKGKVDEIATFPVVTLGDGHLPLHQSMLKEAMDFTGALLGILIWLFCFHWWLALLIRKDSPGPVFFKQIRVGRDGRKFHLWKYRTMHIDAPRYGVAPTEEDDPRVTRFGRWLRKTSLDEIPQLLNVLLGDMSLVGPRPEMPFIVKNYRSWERRRLDVKPGITGLWQVIGRKNLPLHLNMQYDLYYIKNQSFLLDVEILFRTIPAVLKGKGAF